jgi:hypothetical protein
MAVAPGVGRLEVNSLLSTRGQGWQISSREITSNPAAANAAVLDRGRSPVGNSYHAGIDEPTAIFLQQFASDTVQDYYRK